MKFLLIVSFLFLSACVSSPKKAYDSVRSNSPTQQTLRGISFLNNRFESEGSNFDFVAKQMKNVVEDYKKMKNQLAQINDKLDQALNKLALYELKKVLPGAPKDSTPLEDQIKLRLKNNEELFLRISKKEDYKQLIGQLVAGDFDIDEEEKERLLTLLKAKVNPSAEDSMEEIEQLEKIEEKNLEEEDLLINPDLTEETDVFSSQRETAEQKKISDSWDRLSPIPAKPEELSFFWSGKSLFQSQAYETAISELERYRSKNPKGEFYPEATFYIGKAFNELKMPVEADIFFKELVQNHPQSLWAGKAQELLEK